MNNEIRRIVRHQKKKSTIFKSEHDPFLLGNIAKGGVIGTISRKAISPLASQITSFHGSRDLPIAIKLYFYQFRQFHDISSIVMEEWRIPDYKNIFPKPVSNFVP